MRNAKILVALATVLLTPACGPLEFLNPCYKAEDLVLDPALATSWKDEDGATVLKFQESGEKSYEMITIEQHGNAGPEETKYDAHLLRLGEYLFLDLVPEVAKASPGAYKLTLASLTDLPAPKPTLTRVGDGLYASLVPGQPAPESGYESECCEVHLIQAHWVYQVRLDGTSLRLADLSEDWFKEGVKEGKIHIGFENIDDTLVLTGPTEELRQFLLDNAGDGLAFPEDGAMEFRRQE